MSPPYRVCPCKLIKKIIARYTKRNWTKVIKIQNKILPTRKRARRKQTVEISHVMTLKYNVYQYPGAGAGGAAIFFSECGICEAAPGR
jgi:hypothetical protein